MNGINRVARWLYKALQLDEPDLPTMLDTGALLPMLDAYQGGWPLMRWRVERTTIPASSGSSATTQLVPTNPDEVAIILGIIVSRTGGAAAQNVQVRFNDETINRSVRIREPNIGVGGTLYSADLLGDRPYQVVPPGIAFEIVTAATGVGETYDIRAVVGTAPAGFKPI